MGFSKNGTSPGSSKNLGTTPNVKLTASESMFGSLKVIFWTSGIHVNQAKVDKLQWQTKMKTGLGNYLVLQEAVYRASMWSQDLGLGVTWIWASTSIQTLSLSLSHGFEPPSKHSHSGECERKSGEG